MIQALIGPIASLAGTWLEGKVEKTKAETGAKVARAKAEATIMEKKATGELEWDLEMARGSQSSWKDEWLVILFSVPLILSFIQAWKESLPMASSSWTRCPNGINIHLVSLLPHRSVFVAQPSFLERNKNG